MHVCNIDLSIELSDIEDEVLHEKFLDSLDNETLFSFQTKCGRKYSPSIWKLYYSLLTKQDPTTKIADIIRTVLKCFDPSLDVDQLKLPQRTCASYMRKKELRTINNAQKASIFCEDASLEKQFHLNSDGTTKHQKSLGQ